MSCAISSLYYARNPATDFLHYSIGTAGCLGMRMETVSNVCGKCSAKIPSSTRQGVCPACLLETGLGLLYDEDENTTDQEPMPRRKHGTPP
ncbi:MAG TPA: hypothetical protein VFH87_06765, partial [Candidatus Udaeobacter sp.]|nr:hypothetical protein [Candidatus Udaeobacter sp.]